jgi:hypothetical protein
MGEDKMDLIAKYIYAVTRYLPSSQRAEVEKELHGLIEDLLLERTSAKNPAKKDIEAVLLELGEPSLLADKYRGTKRFLIGPNHYEIYLFILKIVTLSVAFGLTMAMAIGYVVNPPEQFLEALLHYIGSIAAAIAQVFAGITIAFALFEHYGVQIFDLSGKKREWRPSDLPSIPLQAALIKPVEPILGIIFAVLFIILLNAANQFIGLYIHGQDSGLTVIPLFNQEVFTTFLPYFNVLLFLAIGKECLKLVIGKWTLPLAFITIGLNAASLIVFIMAFSRFDIFNEGFLSYIVQIEIFPAGTDTERILSQFTKGMMGVVAFALIVDSIVSMAKALKHKVTQFLG